MMVFYTQRIWSWMLIPSIRHYVRAPYLSAATPAWDSVTHPSSLVLPEFVCPHSRYLLSHLSSLSGRKAVLLGLNPFLKAPTKSTCAISFTSRQVHLLWTSRYELRIWEGFRQIVRRVAVLFRQVPYPPSLPVRSIFQSQHFGSNRTPWSCYQSASQLELPWWPLVRQLTPWPKVTLLTLNSAPLILWFSARLASFLPLTQS